MSDKDQFTFEDDDDFQETDLSDAFSDGEHEAEDPVMAAQEDFEPVEDVKKSKKVKVSDGSGSRTRILLLVLLIVIGGAAGAYYFMDLGGTTPSVPTVPVPAKEEVAAPEKPAKVPAETKVDSAKPVQVAVPPPPKPVQKPETEEPVQKAAAQEQGAADVSEPVAKNAEEKPRAEAPVEAAAKTPAAVPAPAQDSPAAQAKPAESQVATSSPASEKPAEKPAVKQESKAVVAPEQVAGGDFALDAGSYLFESNRDALIEKIKKLGYEPLVTPVDATLDMTRLRIGTFSKSEVKEALDFARTIESGAYSAPAGDKYVIYAGTYLSKGSIANLTKRFNDMGIKVYPEPVQVVRTLSRIRFGSFASKEDAAAAATAASDKGVQAVVVKSK